MDRRYKHLNGEERGVILAEHRRGASLGAIGLLLGRSASTIGRELLRLKFQVQHPEPAGHRMLRWTDEASTSAARNVA